MYTYEDIQKQKAGLLKCQKDHIETCCDCDDNFRCTLQMQHIEFEEAQQQEIERLNKVLDDWKYNAKCDADHIAGLLADKDEQAGRIMQMDYLLRRALPILEVANDQQKLIEAIDALLGGKEE